MKKWFIIYLKNNCEKKLITQLRKKRVEYYYPFNNFSLNFLQKKLQYSVPELKSYFFVHVHENELQNLKNNIYVKNLIYWLDKPVVIEDIDIILIQRFFAQYQLIELKKIDIDFNDTIHLQNLTSNTNIYKQFQSHFCAKMTIPSLGIMIIGERQNLLVRELIINENIAV